MWYPIVGTFDFIVPDFTGIPAFPNLYGGVTFQEGGTLNAQDSAGIEQPVVGPTINGAYGTVWTGIWKKICKRQYKVVYTVVLNLKDIKNPYLPGIPFARLKNEVTLKLSKDGQTFTADANLFFYDLVTGNLIAGPVPATILGQRLKIDF